MIQSAGGAASAGEASLFWVMLLFCSCILRSDSSPSNPPEMPPKARGEPAEWECVIGPGRVLVNGRAHYGLWVEDESVCAQRASGPRVTLFIPHRLRPGLGLRAPASLTKPAVMQNHFHVNLAFSSPGLTVDRPAFFCCSNYPQLLGKGHAGGRHLTFTIC